MSDSRTAIARAFSRQLAERGYLGASLESVAREVAIKKPSIYHHFPGGKETLFEAVAGEYITEQGDRVDAAIGGGRDLTDTLTRLVCAFADPDGGLRSLDQRIYEALAHVEDDVRQRISADYLGRLTMPVAQYFARAVADGELARRDEGLLACAFLEMARAADLAADPEAQARDLVDLFLHGAAPR